MDQLSFSEAEDNLKKKKNRREKFLEQMDALIPWKQLERIRFAVIILSRAMGASLIP